MKIKSIYKFLFIVILLVISTFLISRFVSTKGLIIKEYNVINKNIPESFYGFKIVHLSDIYYNSTTNKKDLDKISKEINKLEPDIVIFTGDIFDKNIKYTKEDYKDLTNFFSSIDSNIEKLAIKGDNDLKNSNWEKIINDSGFTDLSDNYKYIYYKSNSPILITGISSNYENNHIAKSIKDISYNVKNDYSYSIMLIHEADYIEDIEYTKYNLILGGHSLNGQIVLPFIGGIIKNKGSNVYYDNYYDFDNTKIYISSGIGTNSKYKFRLFNKPSINLYRLRNK